MNSLLGGFWSSDLVFLAAAAAAVGGLDAGGAAEIGATDVTVVLETFTVSHPPCLVELETWEEEVVVDTGLGAVLWLVTVVQPAPAAGTY